MAVTRLFFDFSKEWSPWSESFFNAFPFNLTLTQSYIPLPEYYYSFNSPSWNISNEFFFYALFPFLIARKPKTLFFISLFIFSMILVAWLSQKVYQPLQGIYNWLFYINPFFRLFEFIIGILVFHLVCKNSLLNRKMKETAIATSFELGSILLLFILIFFIDNIPNFLSKGVFFGPIFALVIYVFYFESGVISKLLSNKFFIYLGEISFGMYMWHQIVFRYLNDYSIDKFLIANTTIGFCLTLIFVMTLSSISFHLLETPMNKLIKSKLR